MSGRAVTDTRALLPLKLHFSFPTAWVRLVGPIQDDSYDVVRKGLGSSAGGDWKMEIKNFQRLGAETLMSWSTGSRLLLSSTTVT
jgi:hypothetical protein